MRKLLQPCTRSGAAINSKFAILPLLLILSCGETEQLGNKLSASERAWLRARAAAKCISESNTRYSNIIEESTDNFLEYERNESTNEWEYIFKKDNSVVNTHKMYVWKVNSDNVIFRIEIDGATKTNVFLKYTALQNNDLLRSIQEDGCAETYDVSVGSTTLSLIHNDENFSPDSTTTQTKLNRTYSFTAAYPGFFGHMTLAMTKNFFDLDDKPVTTPAQQKFDYTFTLKDFADQDATAATVLNKHYCMINSAAAVPPATYRKYTFPIDVLNPTVATSVTNMVCQNTTAPIITIGTESFDPATEL